MLQITQSLRAQLAVYPEPAIPSKSHQISHTEQVAANKPTERKGYSGLIIAVILTQICLIQS